MDKTTIKLVHNAIDRLSTERLQSIEGLSGTEKRIMWARINELCKLRSALYVLEDATPMNTNSTGENK